MVWHTDPADAPRSRSSRWTKDLVTTPAVPQRPSEAARSSLAGLVRGAYSRPCVVAWRVRALINVARDRHIEGLAQWALTNYNRTEQRLGADMEVRHGDRPEPEVSGDGGPGQISAAVCGICAVYRPQEWRTSFGEIESIIGFELPACLHVSTGPGGPIRVAATATARRWPGASPDGKRLRSIWMPRRCCSGGGRARRPFASSVLMTSGPSTPRQCGRKALGLRREDIYEDRMLARPMFVDTNVLVKSRILGAPDHDIARTRLEHGLQGLEPLRISRQVLREYLSVLTRPQTWPVAITREDALDDVNRLMGSFEVLEDGPAGNRRR